LAKTKVDPELELLTQVELFEGLTKSELRTVHHQMREITFEAGAVVLHKGEEHGRFYLIVEGEAEVSLGDDGTVDTRLGPGGYFGEIAVIDGEPRMATVTAITPLRTLSVASFNFRPLLREHGQITYKILLQMCRRLRAAEGSARVDAPH
jgi:CRP-like cAMP-binding protein